MPSSITYQRQERERAHDEEKKHTGLPTLYLARHGHTVFNGGNGSPDRIRGWADIPLDEEGKKGAEELANYFKNKGIDCIYTSDLPRALETAGIIAEKLEIPIDTVTDELRPWNLGKFQGQDSEVAQPALEKYTHQETEKVPEGESFLKFESRFRRRLLDMMDDAKKETILAITHYRDLMLTQSLLDSPLSPQKLKSANPDLTIFLAKDDPKILKLTEKNGNWTVTPINFEGDKE